MLIFKRVISFFWSLSNKHLGRNYLLLAVFAGSVAALMPFTHNLGSNLTVVNFNGKLLQNSHGIIMIFFVLFPTIIGGFGNWLLPSMLHSKGCAMPRTNAMAFLLLACSLSLFLAAVSSEIGSCSLAWWLFASLLAFCTSIILTCLNFFVTIVVACSSSNPIHKMPAFVWSLFIISALAILFMPILLALLTLKAVFGLSTISHIILTPVGNQEVSFASFKILFWFFFHIVIYIFLLPALGIINHIIENFTKKDNLGIKITIAVMHFVALASFILWAENIFAPVSLSSASSYFMVALPLMLLPYLIISLNIVTALIKQRIDLNVILNWCLGFLFMTFIGLISAFRTYSYLPSIKQDDAAAIGSVISHFHYILFLPLVFAIFAGWYFWFPKIIGYRFSNKIAHCHFYSLLSGVNFVFLPQLFSFAHISSLRMIGALLIVFSLLFFLFNIIYAYKKKNTYNVNAWNNENGTIEWQLGSYDIAKSN